MTILGVALATRSSAATAEETRLRSVGVIVGLADDSEMQERTKAFEEGLGQRGWIVGRNIRISYRFCDNSTAQMRQLAKEVVELQPDCIVAHSTPVCAELKQLTRTIPVIFVSVSDPIGSGFVASMARPGGNMTGFTIQQSTITSKYLEVLKELVPGLTQVVALYNPGTAPGGGSFFLPSFEDAAKKFNVKPINAQVKNDVDIEHVIKDASLVPASGMVIMPDNFTTFYRAEIIALAAKFRIPTIYPYRYFVKEGGLLSLGADGVDLFKGAADYVDRILRGASPAELPVQRPDKVELAINLITAKALRLDVPRILLAGADTVIE
jgi:putative tryptophan/tyrosine transport system substrate-binding protein